MKRETGMACTHTIPTNVNDLLCQQITTNPCLTVHLSSHAKTKIYPAKVQVPVSVFEHNEISGGYIHCFHSPVCLSNKKNPTKCHSPRKTNHLM